MVALWFNEVVAKKGKKKLRKAVQNASRVQGSGYQARG